MSAFASSSASAMGGSRVRGWTAVTMHATPWLAAAALEASSALDEHLGRITTIDAPMKPPGMVITYLVRGRLLLRIGDETHAVEPGDSWCISGGTAHGATILEDAVAIEVFSPVREDLLPSRREG